MTVRNIRAHRARGLLPAPDVRDRIGYYGPEHIARPSLFAKVLEQCRAVAHEFVRLFLEDLWKPFAQEGYPQRRWAEVTESIERLRPLSSRALLAAYQLTMSREVEAAFGRELERLTKRRR